MDSNISHLRDLYGLNPNIPHLAFQFPRLPPGLTHPMFKIFENPLREKFSQDTDTMNTKLQGFQKMYREYAGGLFRMDSTGIIPPGHPLYNRKNSVDTLKGENNKLQKENLELKKQLEDLKNNSKKH